MSALAARRAGGSVAVVVLAVGLLGACATTVPTRGAFDAAQEQAATRQMAPGTATIRGTAFVHSAEGRTYTAAGDWITLIPVTDYASERIRIIFGQQHRRDVLRGAQPDAADPRYLSLTRRVKANVHGRFAFEDVTAGSYYVTALVAWQRAGKQFAFMVYDTVAVAKDGTEEVVLSGH